MAVVRSRFLRAGLRVGHGIVKPELPGHGDPLLELAKCLGPDARVRAGQKVVCEGQVHAAGFELHDKVPHPADGGVGVLPWPEDPGIAIEIGHADLDVVQGVSLLQFQYAPGEGFQFAVTLAPGRQLIGDCALRCPEHDPQQAELGFTFATEHQGQGFASEAVGRVVEYAFATLGLHRIFALTDVRNHPAKRLLERLGFRCEGKLEQSAWYKGEWVSEFLYARLRAEWQCGAG